MRVRGPGILVLSLLLPACGTGTSRKDPPVVPPSDVAVASPTSGRSVLTWKDNTDGEAGFRVERSEDAGATWKAAVATLPDATSAVDAGLVPARTYHYRIRAVFPWGASEPSQTAPATLPNMAWAPSPDSPPELGARWNACAVYDALHQRLLVVGGADEAGFRNDVWALPLQGDDLSSAVWEAVATAGAPPEARTDQAAVYDPVRGRLILFGGFGFSGLSDELWTLSLPPSGTPTWAPLVLPGGPSPRSLASAVYDAAGDRVIFYGGVTGASHSDETWALRLSGPGAPSWANLGPGPQGLVEHVAAYDPDGRRMLVYGGGGNGTANGSVYGLALPRENEGLPYAWTTLVPAASAPPAPRAAASAVLDAANRRWVVYGGYDESMALRDEVWVLSLAGDPSWSEVVPSGTAPPPRAYAPAVHDPVRGRMVVFSGFDADLWEFIDDRAWILQF